MVQQGDKTSPTTGRNYKIYSYLWVEIVLVLPSEGCMRLTSEEKNVIKSFEKTVCYILSLLISANKGAGQDVACEGTKPGSLMTLFFSLQAKA